MNLGEKIKSLREGKGLTIDELATKINDEPANLSMYENNELEPTLDKKLALSIELGVSLDELSYSIEQKYTKIEKHTQEEGINLEVEETYVEEKEEPFAKSTITYNEDVFNQVFKDSHTRSSIQSAIFILGYVLCGVFTLTSQLTIFSYLCFGIAAFSLVKLIMSFSRYKASKKAWLQEYSHTTREYSYYKEYLEVTSNNDESKKIEYKAILRVIENKNYLIALYYEGVPTFLVIETSGFVDDELIKIRTALKENCPNYIDINLQRQEKTLNPKMKKWNIVLWVFAILALFSITIVSNIIRIFNQDNTLMVNLLTYGLALILPVISIILGVISKKKKNFPSSKNTIIGLIMTIGCILFMFLSVAQYQLYKAHNNDELVLHIENITNTQIPDDYNTIYIDETTSNETRGELNYIISSYNVWTFNKVNEVKSLEESIENNLKWQKNTNEIQNSYGFNLNNDVKTVLNGLSYEVSEQADYIMLINLNNNETNNLIDSTGDRYLSLMYYDEGNYFIVVEFTCSKTPQAVE